MKFIILTGPTGTGKTKLSLSLAKDLSTEIISADSMQIYRMMDIGTDKIKTKDMNGIKHHMIDIVDPDQNFTVEDFKKQTFSIIEDLNNEGKIPLIVGGTGLFLNSLIYDLNFTVAPPNEHVRSYYEALADKHGNEFLHDILKSVDPISADKNHPNQRKRIIRALEVFDYTGRAFSSFDQGPKYLDNVEFLYIVLNRDRQKLYERINSRVDQMLEEGLVEEVKALLAKGYDKDLTSMQAIGYKEIIMYLNGECNLDFAIDKVKQHSRNYAKRQLSWFRREPTVNEVFIDSDDSLEDVKKKCMNLIEDFI